MSTLRRKIRKGKKSLNTSFSDMAFQAKAKFMFGTLGRKYMECRTKGKFMPYTVSLKTICDKFGHPEYFQPCRNRIWREAEEYGMLMGYIRINPLNPADVVLDDKGIMFFDDILNDYFGEEYVDNLYEYLTICNRVEKLVLKLPEAIKQHDTDTLLQALKALKEGYAELPTGDDLMKKLIDVTENELRQRNVNLITGGYRK